MHLVVLTRQIGHYHDARYRGAAATHERLTVVSSANQGGFAEFLAKDTGDYAVVRLTEDRAAYDRAVAEGTIGAKLATALDGLAPDALAVSGWTNPESVAAIGWARSRKVPLVMMSETQADDAARSRLAETVKARIVSLCDAALVGGPPHAAYITRLGIPSPRVHLGYNAVDNAHFAAGAAAARADAATVRSAHGLPPRYLLASARFIAKKNLAALVTGYAAALGAAGGAGPDLVILGDGETRAEILAATEAGGVATRVHLPGFRGYEALPAYYGLAEAFCHVSTVEQWGLVVNEAMAAGLPAIVSTPCGVGRTVVEDGVSGLLTAPDAASIGAALARLMAMPAEARAAMGQAAAAAIADWGPQRFGAGMRAAVDSARAAPRRGRPAPWDAAILAHMQRRIIERVA